MHKIACFYVTVSDSVLNKDSFVRSFIHSFIQAEKSFCYSFLLARASAMPLESAYPLLDEVLRWRPRSEAAGTHSRCMLFTAVTEWRGECAEQGSEETKIPATHTGRHYFRNLEGACLLHYRSKIKSGMWPLQPAVFTPHSRPCVNARARWLRMLFGCNVSSEIFQKKLQRAIEGREDVHMLQTTSCSMVLVARIMKLSWIMTRNCGLFYSDVVTWESSLTSRRSNKMTL